MPSKTFILEWDTDSLESMAEALLFGLPSLERQLRSDTVCELDRTRQQREGY